MDYIIKLDEFEGPLDLLLHLVKQSNVDIYNIKIDVITKQYLDAIKQMEDMNLNVASEYLVMAAELIELKSRSLLPVEESNNEDEYIEDPKETLIRKLIEYEKYKNITSTFKDLESERNLIFTKSPESLKEYQTDEVIRDDEVTVVDLVKAFDAFMERQKLKEPLATKVTSKEISISERSNYIRNKLKINKQVKFTELFDIMEKSYIIATFLAVLEMTKKQEIKLEQKYNFDDIIVSLRGSHDE